ncbi:hypothetical protein ADICYQ_5258 [Cyclobacterium qasimii M12-11B]|uniref:Uncharacterized protein n=1 Tax=Cyclobacterium qasimii M12-11B TaxID=641524 RepID=S7WNJ4_9BACT|nr:hypothetical protein ADICYQ_5258 [Cyclobacterium qasimii M12-11B]
MKINFLTNWSIGQKFCSDQIHLVYFNLRRAVGADVSSKY